MSLYALAFSSKAVSIFGSYIDFGLLSYPVTILWIVALINAFNLIDGLDGLSCGICAICCVSMFTVAVLYGGTPRGHSLHQCSLVLAFGFLPFNLNPGSYFYGRHRCLFLIWVRSPIISIQGVIKVRRSYIVYSSFSYLHCHCSILHLPLYDAY